MTRDDEPDNRWPTNAAILIFVRLLAVPFVGLITLMLPSKHEKAVVRAEADRLWNEHRGREAEMDRYLNSRDGADDNETKELFLEAAPATTDPIAADAGSAASRRQQ
ncbi:hypothetical protein [Tabrizicola sp.]|uniref:hypothetical protein n=1 Tax=Tabrizicola sp. TaxID=2005166 RepID=UPI003F39423C